MFSVPPTKKGGEPLSHWKENRGLSFDFGRKLRLNILLIPFNSCQTPKLFS